MYKKIKLACIIIIYVTFILFNTSNVFSVSNELIKNVANTKYERLIECIKSHNNDSSKCIEKYKGYIKEEIKAIKKVEDNNDLKERLQKTLNYLEKSTKKFYEKAQKNNNSLYYNKASKCAELLTSVSDKYSKYKKYIENANKTEKYNTYIKSKLSTLNSKKYPSKYYINEFESLKQDIVKVYDNLSIDVKDKFRKIAKNNVTKFLSHLKSIQKSIDEFNKPKFKDLRNKHKIYRIAKDAPDIHGRSESIQNLITDISQKINSGLNQLKNKQKIVSNKYRNSNNEYIELFIKNNNKKYDTLIHAYNETINMQNIFQDLQTYKICQFSAFHKFFININEANNKYEKNNWKESIRYYQKAIEINEVGQELINKANKDKAETIGKGLEFYFQKSKKAKKANEYKEALNQLDKAMELPLSSKQKNKLAKTREELIQESVSYYTNKSKELYAAGEGLNSLKTIKHAKNFLNSDKIDKQYLSILDNYNFSEVDTPKQAMNLVENPNKLFTYLNKPNKVGKNKFCASFLKVAQQFGSNKFRAYLYNDDFVNTDYEILVKIINPEYVGLPLSNKTCFVVFNVRGTKDVTRLFKGNKSVLTYVKAVYVEIH